MRQDLTSVVPVAGREHRIGSGRQALFLWEKRAPEGPVNGTILFVHGSSVPSVPQFDLQVPGRPQASMMDWFASRGFDTWCFDCRGYGRSYKGAEVLATCAEGADDAAAVSGYIAAERNAGKLFLYGGSSGALRAAIFTERHPQRVRGLALDGMVWTGEGSRTLAQRRAKLDQWRSSTRRPIDPAFMNSIVTRDEVATGDELLAKCFAEQVLAEDDSMPNGTYIDMCANLPLVDPERISVPTLIMRGEFDGIATLDDLLKFFAKLKTPAKELYVMQGVAHATFLQKNYMLAYHGLYSFFLRPQAVYTE